MLSLFLKDSFIDNVQTAVPKARLEKYLARFEEGAVRIFFQFDGTVLTYVCYLEEEYGRFTVSLDARCAIYDTPLSYALLLYVRKIDEGSDKETLRRLYGEYYADLSLYATLGSSKAKLFLEAGKKVEELVSRIEASKRSAPTPMKPTLVFVAAPSRGEYEVCFRIGFSKLYLNRRVATFLRDYYSGTPQQIQKQYVTLPKNSFNEATEDALRFLHNQVTKGYYYYPGAYGVRLSTEEFLEFLFLLQGETLEYDGAKVLVRQAEDIVVSIDEQGKVHAAPTLPERVERGDDRAFYVDKEKGALSLYRFSSVGAAELYGFLREFKGVNSTYLMDQLAKRVLPLLDDDDVQIDPRFEQDHPVIRPRIQYYIGLEEQRALSFQTKYLLGREEVDEKRFALHSLDAQNKMSAFQKEVEDLGLELEGKSPGEEALVSFLSADLTALKSLAEVYVSEELASINLSGVPEIRLQSSSGEDWFHVDLYASGYSEEELLQIFKAFSRKKKYVRLRDKIIVLNENDERIKALAENFNPEDIGVDLPLYQALKIPAISGEYDAEVRDLIEKVEHYSSVEITSIPSAIKEVARPYQNTGIQFMYNLYRLGLSGVLSDDMGLGKTLQSFGLFSLIKADKPILVVCPKSLIYNWMQERDKWDPSLPAYILTGSPLERKAIYAKMGKEGKACYFISYDTLRNDIAHIKNVDFSLMLLDEGQYIANAAALKTRAVKMVKADSRFVLTGTPVQNSLTDLWSIFDFLLPGYFPPLRSFRETYGALDLSSDEAKKRLLAKIKPFLLGRKKKDVLKELPDKENISLAIAMNDEQRKIYDAYLAKAREAITEGQDKLKVIAMLTRLRQICINPALFLEGEFESGKIEYLISALTELKESGRKALVFSSFTSALDLVAKSCKEAGLSYENIRGDTSAKVRVILAERFNKPDSPIDVMLVSLKAGGTGLNLIGADTVFHLDPWWNLAAERQAEDRAHRIGQKNKVTVIKLVCQNTVEERILSLQKRKGLLIDLADEASLASALTDEDYQFLLA